MEREMMLWGNRRISILSRLKDIIHLETSDCPVDLRATYSH